MNSQPISYIQLLKHYIYSHKTLQTYQKYIYQFFAFFVSNFCKLKKVDMHTILPYSSDLPHLLNEGSTLKIDQKICLNQCLSSTQSHTYINITKMKIYSSVHLHANHQLIHEGQ